MHHSTIAPVNNCYHRCSYYCWYHEELRDKLVYAEFIQNDPTAKGKEYWKKKKKQKTTQKEQLEPLKTARTMFAR